MRILCVCGLGQGTSLILRMNVEEVLDSLGIQADVEHTDVSSASSSIADYIVTNSVLALEVKNDIKKIIVENYFDKDEIRAALKNNII